MSAIYLKHIEMTGLFGYKNLSWEVNQDVNILGGDNGSGKSTVFQICYLLLGYGFVNDSRYERLVETIKLLFTNGYALFWDKQKMSDSQQRNREYSYYTLEGNMVEKDGSLLVQRVKVTNEKGEVVDPSILIGSVITDYLSSFDQTIIDAQILKNDKDNGDRTYLDRLLSSFIAYRNARVSQILINSLTESKPDQGNADEHSLTIKSKDAQYIVLFNQALKEFFGDNYTIKDGMESRISMISRETGELIKYQDLSLGEKEMLLLIVLVSNTYDDPVILWLDEPDLGLHVDWQVKLVKNLIKLNPNIQLFVSTHAPSMVEGNQNKVKEMSEISNVNNG